MISDIRKTLQTRPVKILLWMLVGSFFVGIIPLAFRRGQNGGDSLGTVNGIHIGLLEYKRKLKDIQNIVRDIRQVYGNQAEMALKMWGLDKPSDEVVLEALINEKIMKSLTSSLGAQINLDYLQAKIRDPYFVRQHLGNIIPPQALVGGGIDTAALEYNLERQGISHDEFDEILNDSLLRALVSKLIVGGSYIPESALRDAYIGQYLKKKYSYISLPRSRYVAKAKETKISDEEIKEFFSKASQQEQYRIPEKRSGKVWSFSPETFGVVVTDKDLEAAYLRQKRLYIKNPASVQVQHILLTFTPETKVEVRARAQALYKEVLANITTFADVAAKNSQSKDRGTTLTLKRTDKNSAFTKEAFGLQKGSVSPVIETEEGFEIIKLIDRKEPEYKSLDEVKGELTKKLKDEKFNQAFAANAQRVVSQSKEEPALLGSFIERHKGHESSITDAIRNEKQLNSRLFSIRRVGDRAFFEEAGKGYIIELTALNPSTVPTLQSVKNDIAEKLYALKALELMKKDLQRGLADLQDNNVSLKNVAQTLHSKVESTDWVLFTDQESLKKLQQLKVKLADLIGLTTKGASMSDITDKDGYIIQVTDIEPLNEKEFQDKKSLLRFQLGRQEQQGFSTAFAEALKEAAQISLNSEIVRSAKG